MRFDTNYRVADTVGLFDQYDLGRAETVGYNLGNPAVLTANGDMYTTMWSYNRSGVQTDSIHILIAKLDTLLDVKWEKLINVPFPQSSHTIQPLSDGRLHLITKQIDEIKPDGSYIQSYYSYFLDPDGFTLSGPTPFPTARAVTLSPNPAGNTARVTGLPPDLVPTLSHGRLTTAAGQVYGEVPIAADGSLNVAAVPPGVYFVEFYDAAERKVTEARLMKQ